MKDPVTSAQVIARRAHCGPTTYDLYQRPAGECGPPTARPGQSMHEWGLAVDITSAGGLIRSRNDPGWHAVKASPAPVTPHTLDVYA